MADHNNLSWICLLYQGGWSKVSQNINITKYWIFSNLWHYSQVYEREETVRLEIFCSWIQSFPDLSQFLGIHRGLEVRKWNKNIWYDHWSLIRRNMKFQLKFQIFRYRKLQLEVRASGLFPGSWGSQSSGPCMDFLFLKNNWHDRLGHLSVEEKVQPSVVPPRVSPRCDALLLLVGTQVSSLHIDY